MVVAVSSERNKKVSTFSGGCIVSNVGNDVNARAVVNARARECAICHMRFSCNLKCQYVMLKDILL